jgi:hypothetical protein
VTFMRILLFYRKLKRPRSRSPCSQAGFTKSSKYFSYPSISAPVLLLPLTSLIAQCRIAAHYTKRRHRVKKRIAQLDMLSMHLSRSLGFGEYTGAWDGYDCAVPG